MNTEDTFLGCQDFFLQPSSRIGPKISKRYFFNFLKTLCYIKVDILMLLFNLNLTEMFYIFHRLVISDLVFYTGSFNTLKGLEGLVKDTKAVWDVR